MMGTIDCVYETPCHWCSKWDKECDRKMRNTKNECNHHWERTSRGSGSADENGVKTYTIWKCKWCGAEKEVED